MPATTALLLLLLDSRAPAGGHGHSGGMEAAVTEGLVAGTADVEQYCRFRLRTSGLAAAAFAAVAARLWRDGAGPPSWAELDAEFSARLPAEAARAASRQTGGGLRRLARALAPHADLVTPWQGIRPAPHYPLVLGAAVMIAGGDEQTAALAAALSSCTAPASAAVRLLGLDPYAVQAILAGLSADIDRAAVLGAAFATGEPAGRLRLRDLPALSAPALDLLADVHARSEVRLFAS